MRFLTNKFLYSITLMLTQLVCLSPGFNNQFDSRGGTFDYQTGWGWHMPVWYELTKQTFFSRFRSKTSQNETAGGKGVQAANSALFQRKLITKGDELQFTSHDAITGLVTYGDKFVNRGNAAGYKNLSARTNMIKAPAIPLPGTMSAQRAKFSINNIPAQTKQDIKNYFSDELEFQVLYTLFNGASPAILAPKSQGGLGARLGIGDGHTASVPLMGKNWYTNDGGFIAYNNTHATWNSTVNDAINACTVTADQITLAAVRRLRAHLDTIPWTGATFGGKRYKAISFCDPELWYRLDSLLDTKYQAARERSATNPTFGVDYDLEYNGILFVNTPNMDKFRPSYSSALSRPLFGPTFAEDPRTYTNSSDIAAMVLMGDSAVFEGYNGGLAFTRKLGDHSDGNELSARTQVGYIRGEFYANDGRTTDDQVYSPSMAFAAFYEPGVGQ